jgi:peptidoglycan/xylan/chitin deacetylase (PgdA/CDA1 family)
MRPVPILLYHSVSETPSPVLRGFTVSPTSFARQLDAIAATGATTLTVSQYVAALDAGTLPEPAVIITFDDGFADFYDHALPALGERSLACTLYVATGFLGGRPALRVSRRPPDRMLEWRQLPELRAAGIEIGAHSHSHFHLDTLSRHVARDEIASCKTLLEHELQQPVPSFAYPNGHLSPTVRQLVIDAGYDSACGVRNALSWEHDDRFRLARLTVRSATDDDTFLGWLEGRGARVAPRRELLTTRAFRAYRRSRSILARQPGSDFRVRLSAISGATV